MQVLKLPVHFRNVMTRPCARFKLSAAWRIMQFLGEGSGMKVIVGDALIAPAECGMR